MLASFSGFEKNFNFNYNNSSFEEKNQCEGIVPVPTVRVSSGIIICNSRGAERVVHTQKCDAV